MVSKPAELIADTCRGEEIILFYVVATGVLLKLC